MFIIAKRNFLIQISGREPYRIKKDYIGEIPEDVAAHWLVRAAIADGTIATPQGEKIKHWNRLTEKRQRRRLSQI